MRSQRREVDRKRPSPPSAARHEADGLSDRLDDLADRHHGEVDILFGDLVAEGEAQGAVGLLVAQAQGQQRVRWLRIAGAAGGAG